MNTIASYTPQPKHVYKGKLCTTLDEARALLQIVRLPLWLCYESVSTAAYPETITPIVSFNFVSPYYLQRKNQLCYEHLQVFECLPYIPSWHSTRVREII